MLDASDRIALHELVALYGHLIDQRRWDDLDQVFTDDVLFEGIHATTHSIAEKVALWTSETSETGIRVHPVAHHITNTIVTEDPDGTVRIICKGLGVRAAAPPRTIVYEDVAVRTDRGWRIAHRRATDRNKQAIELGQVFESL